ncbi:chemotaxis response regulator protein-glutamate methylesterase 3 [Sphingomonas sp. DBB INV C78]|uniref:chemotaxis-specific protein-glutamate methyltransferase CheB n=1 Tax=Sphingomonas sp. DBB INV C78 TaxID=3349434 RepID=UPI0036D2EDB8
MIKLLIVDDSPLMRRLLTEIFAAAGDFEIEVARNGAEAIERIPNFAPDVVTLDIHMPGMDGLACLDQIMLIRPCPVVMVSSLTAEGADETLEAMALGAVDFIPKPRGSVSLEIDALAPALVEKVRAAAGARISRTTRLRDRVRARVEGTIPGSSSKARRAQPPSRLPMPRQVKGEGLVLVGSSTGGPPALDALLGPLPENFPWPIVIAQHMPASFTGPLARRLDRLSALNISEVTTAAPLLPGHAYIGRGDADLIISRRAGTLTALAAPASEDYFWHPSVDRLVTTAMRVVAPERLIGVLLTGMGADGAKAMSALKQNGGSTIAEAQETAIVWGMPGALVAAGGASIIAPLGRVASELMALLAE